MVVGDLGTGDVMGLLERWCARARRSRIPQFVTTGATIRKSRAGGAAAIDRGLSNGRHEGLHSKIRAMTARARGFHGAEAVLAFVILTGGPTTLALTYPRSTCR